MEFWDNKRRFSSARRIRGNNLLPYSRRIREREEFSFRNKYVAVPPMAPAPISQLFAGVYVGGGETGGGDPSALGYPVGQGVTLTYDDIKAYQTPTYPGQDNALGQPYDWATSVYPHNSGCPPQDALAGYPRECPQELTFAYLEASAQPQLAFGNNYRQAAGLPPMIWDNYLALAAMRHAVYLSEMQDHYDPPKPPGLEVHYEYPEGHPTYPSFGETVVDRVFNTGRENYNNVVAPAGANVVEGFGGAWNSTGTKGLCTQRHDSDNPPAEGESWGHIGPWADPTTPITHYGWGADQRTRDGMTNHVFVYSAKPAGANSLPLDKELYEYLPKFKCP